MSAWAHVCLPCVLGVVDRTLLGDSGAEVPAVLSLRAVHMSSPPSLPNQHRWVPVGPKLEENESSRGDGGVETT